MTLLTEEREFLKENRDRLMREHAGRFVLIKGRELMGAFETEDEALAAGTKAFGIGTPYLVCELLPESEGERPDVMIPALALGVIDADPSRSA